MYLTAKNTDLNVATCSSPTEVEYSISKYSCVKQSYFLFLESNIQCPTILIAQFTFPSESINCRVVPAPDGTIYLVDIDGTRYLGSI